MEISTAPTANIVKTPEAESETPIRTQPNKPLSVSNGVLKRLQPVVLQPHRHHPPPLNSPPAVVTYKECLKNHAASLGGHAVDGCGEFMPSPTADPANPTSIKCAACGCHRNFHRREPEDPIPSPPNAAQHVIEYQPHHRHHPPPPPPRGGHSSPNSASPPPISSSYYPSAPHMLLALSSGLSAPPTNNNPSGSPTAAAVAAGGSNSSGRKRFRTKFSQDQKERMNELAEKVGWKMQKRDEEMIAEFCSEVGVEKTVFKVWMHNNKSTFGKRDATSNGIDIGIGRNSLDNSDAAAHYHQNDTNHHHNNKR